MAFKVKHAVTMNQRANSLWGKAAMGLEYAFRRTGPLTMAPSQLGGFAKSDPSQPTANVEYHVQPLSLDKFGDPLHAFPAITASVCNLRPASRGYVRIKSADPNAHPAINPRYLSTPEDRKVAADALRLTRRIAAQPAFARYEPEEFKPGPEFQTDDELAKAAGDVGTTIFHPVGTCKMSPAVRPGGGCRRPAARPRARAPARRRCLDHADDHLRQHQLADGDDRRAGRGDDPGGPPVVAPGG